MAWLAFGKLTFEVSLVPKDADLGLEAAWVQPTHQFDQMPFGAPLGE
jgi:hypothetical protein